MIMQVSESIDKPLIMDHEGKKYQYMYSLSAESDIPIIPGFIVVGNNKSGKLDFYKEVTSPKGK